MEITGCPAGARERATGATTMAILQKLFSRFEAAFSSAQFPSRFPAIRSRLQGSIFRVPRMTSRSFDETRAAAHSTGVDPLGPSCSGRPFGREQPPIGRGEDEG